MEETGYRKVVHLRLEREERWWEKVESGKEEVDWEERTDQVCLDGKKIQVRLKCLVWAGDSHSWYGPGKVMGGEKRMGWV